MKHDEHSASSVKAKIAMFSTNAKPSSSSVMTTNSTSMTASLTRSLTHGDVRFEEVSVTCNLGRKKGYFFVKSTISKLSKCSQSDVELVLMSFPNEIDKIPILFYV